MASKQVFDRNMVEILPGQKVRARWPYYYINTRTDEGVVKAIDTYGGVTITTDHPVPHVDRQGFIAHEEPWFYFPSRYNHEKQAYVASDSVGDPYEHGAIPIWIEVLSEEKKGKKPKMGARERKDADLLDKMLEGFWGNPLNPREAVLVDGAGEPIAGVTLHHMNEAAWGPKYLHLEEVRALKPGGGRAAMELLIERADAYCATIAGTVKPLPAYIYGMKKMPQRKLMAWYKEFGFVPEDPGSHDIIRHPDPARCVSG